MINLILCNLWWLLLGGLLGWLASWLLGRGRLSGGAVASAPGIDHAAAKAAGFVVSGADNLEIIEGVGPKIAHRLRSNGVGPFALLDLVGLDTSLSSLETLHASFGDENFVARPMLRDLVEQGRLGRKTKAGFYVY